MVVLRLFVLCRPKVPFKFRKKEHVVTPQKKVILLHRGPEAKHTYFEYFDTYFPDESIEYYYYDHL